MHSEVEIRGFIVNDAATPAVGWDGPVVLAERVVAEVEAHRARGARVLLVTVVGPGGHMDGSRRIYEALRAFAAEGGKVVTYASAGREGDPERLRRVASTASILFLAGDVRVMHLEALIVMHSTLGARPERVAAGNAWMREVYRTRTSLPDAVIDEALACTIGAGGLFQARTIGAEHAPGFGLAHLPGDEHTARALAQQLAGLELVREDRSADLRSAVPVGAIVADKIAASAITASKLAADAIKTSNFASTGSGTSEVATAGAKMQADGTALVVAPGGLKVGGNFLTGLGSVRARGLFYANLTSPYVYQVAGNQGIASVSRVLIGSPHNYYVARINLATGNRPVLDGAMAFVQMRMYDVSADADRLYQAHIHALLLSNIGGTNYVDGVDVVFINSSTGAVQPPSGFTTSRYFHLAVIGDYASAA